MPEQSQRGCDKSSQQDWPIWGLMRGERNLDIENSPPRAWSARWLGEECGRWSTAIDFVRLLRPIEAGAWSNLEGTADAEDTVIGLLGRKTLDGLLDVLALLGNEVVEPIGRLAGAVRRDPVCERLSKNRDCGLCNTTAIAFNKYATDVW